MQVTCGSVIKMEHVKTGHLLHSHEVSYGAGRGSGQQSVTGYPEKDSAGSMWIVRGGKVSTQRALSIGRRHAEPPPTSMAHILSSHPTQEHCPQGTPIKAGTLIRLQHAPTRRWLHTHRFASPLTNNQEVSCFGSNEQSDASDVWEVQWDSNAKHWERDATVRLRHKVTEFFLANHNVKYQRPIPGHTEVHALKSKSAAANWRATEGVYFAGEVAGDSDTAATE